MPASFADAFNLLFTDPADSERVCRELLSEGDDPRARLLLAGSLRLQGDLPAAHAIARALAEARAGWPGAHFELAMVLGKMGRCAEALDALLRAEVCGGAPGLWREIGDQHWAMDAKAEAERAYLRHLSAPQLEPLIHQAGAALRANNANAAEAALRRQLEFYPGDVLAQRLLAEHLSAADRYEEAAVLLRSCLARVPSFALARYGLAMVLFHDHELSGALAAVEELLAQDPLRLEYLTLKAEALTRLGDDEAALACLEKVVSHHPTAPGGWTSLGHSLRALGRREECVAAYRRAVELGSQVGEAYWGLANLKTYRFAPEEVSAMRNGSKVARTCNDGAALQFALGKALEDEGDFEGAFFTYRSANALRRQILPHNREEWSEKARRLREAFTREFFAAREGWGCPAPDPIFVVGMPRSGSTLVEQILASHSAVEGTMELLEFVLIAKRLEKEEGYPAKLAEMTADDIRRIGERYLERTRAFRRTEAPRFIDKMPNNFWQTGLIRLALPNARIIDVRRNPLACCVSVFKQHWATGQTFAYDLEDIGAYYRDYVELMAHFNRALPGTVHRVAYESLVADPEHEIRRLLEVCGLPFEPNCLTFYESKRSVRTPSSEQVRAPIYRSGVESWRPYERWLAPLEDALGPELTGLSRDKVESDGRSE